MVGMHCSGPGQPDASRLRSELVCQPSSMSSGPQCCPGVWKFDTRGPATLIAVKSAAVNCLQKSRPTGSPTGQGLSTTAVEDHLLKNEPQDSARCGFWTVLGHLSFRRVLDQFFSSLSSSSELVCGGSIAHGGIACTLSFYFKKSLAFDVC